MPDKFTEVTNVGLGSRLGNSIKGVVFGILLFLISFVVLYVTEGRVDYSKIASQAVEVGSVEVVDGDLVYVSGKLDVGEKLGDRKYLKEGDYAFVERVVEMYSWEEEKSTKSKKKLGGSETRETTYEYVKEWTDKPGNSASFKHKEGHTNPLQEIKSEEFASSLIEIDGYEINMNGLSLTDDEFRKLTLNNDIVNLPTNEKLLLNDNYIYVGKGNLTAPEIGDLRISYSVVKDGEFVTVFGSLNKKTIQKYASPKGESLLRLTLGNRDQGVMKMKQEYKAAGWVGRIVGFCLMWLGLIMVLAPISVLLDVVPIIGSMGRFGFGLLAFLVALVLSSVTILISMILHSVLALLIVIVVSLIVIFYLVKKSKKIKK